MELTSAGCGVTETSANAGDPGSGSPGLESVDSYWRSRLCSVVRVVSGSVFPKLSECGRRKGMR